MRLAIFGGTFDPVHNAHLVIAREALQHFGLDKVLFVPAGNPPHKKASTPYEHRLRMVELACAAEPRFEVSGLEGDGRVNYSIDTVESLRAALPPGTELFFLIGADAFDDLATWRRWRDVVEQVEFLVVARPGHAILGVPGARFRRLDTVALPVSSSGVREALARGEVPADVPPEVARYIIQHGLYR